MAALNKIQIIGNLGKDPEIKMNSNKKKIASFSVAVTEKGKAGEKTEWFNVIFWERLAEIVEMYLRKGSSVYIEGKLQTRSWENDQGIKQYRTEIIGYSLQMLSNKGEQKKEQQNNFNQPSPIDDSDLPF